MQHLCETKYLLLWCSTSCFICTHIPFSWKIKLDKIDFLKKLLEQLWVFCCIFLKLEAEQHISINGVRLLAFDQMYYFVGALKMFFCPFFFFFCIYRLVKPGGVLVYSTCSIDPEENEERVEAFLLRHPVRSLALYMCKSVVYIFACLFLLSYSKLIHFKHTSVF